MAHHDISIDTGRSDPPLLREAVNSVIRSIHYNEFDANLLLRLMASKDPAIAELRPDSKAQYVALCEAIANFRSLYAGSIRSDRPSLMPERFALPDPLRQSHASQARLDRSTLDRITAHLSEISAKHQSASVMDMGFQMAVLNKVALGVVPRPAILLDAEAFMKSYHPPRTTTDPHTLGIGRGPSVPQQFTTKLKQSITAFERLEDLGNRVVMKQLGAQREAYIDTFVKAQNAAGQCDLAAFNKHLQTLEHLSSTAKRRSLDRVSISAT